MLLNYATFLRIFQIHKMHPLEDKKCVGLVDVPLEISFV